MTNEMSVRAHHAGVACLGLLAVAASCDLQFTSVGSIDDACGMVRGRDLEERICFHGLECIEHDLRCEDASYSTKMSPHTSKDWRADTARAFGTAKRRHRINANFDTYEKWGLGEKRFFTISDNLDDASKSSHTLYFRLNACNMPRLMGATFFDASSRTVREYEFEPVVSYEYECHFEPKHGYTKLAAERAYDVP